MSRNLLCSNLSAYLDRPLMLGHDVFPGTTRLTLRQIEDDIIKRGPIPRLPLVSFVDHPFILSRNVCQVCQVLGFTGRQSLVVQHHNHIHRLVVHPRHRFRSSMSLEEYERRNGYVPRRHDSAGGIVRTESMLQKAKTRPFRASQKLLVLFVITAPLCVLALLTNLTIF